MGMGGLDNIKRRITKSRQGDHFPEATAAFERAGCARRLLLFDDPSSVKIKAIAVFGRLCSLGYQGCQGALTAHKSLFDLI